MKQMFDLEFEPITHRYYSRTSRSKNDEVCLISKMEDFQTSMSFFSTRNETKTNNRKLSSDNVKKNIIKRKKGKKKRVEFNPLITVVNIESFKKENYEGNVNQDGKCPENLFDDNKMKKCLLCSIF